jgi:hypothetical protein
VEILAPRLDVNIFPMLLLEEFVQSREALDQHVVDFVVAIPALVRFKLYGVHLPRLRLN